VAHQLAKVWEQGLASVHESYAPVFAVRLPPWATAAGQLAALPAALVVAVSVRPAVGRFLVVGFLVLWLFSIQRRLANHAWLGTVAVVSMSFVPPDLDPVVAHDLLTGLYVSAALFKINHEYLISDRSAGRVVTRFYATLLRLRTPPWVMKWTPAAVIAVEFVVGVLLCVPHGSAVGLYLAVAMHWVFGVSGNFAFSIVAMSLWLTALSARNGDVVLPGAHSAVWTVVPVGALLALALSRTADGRRPGILILRDVFQGAAYVFLAAAAAASPVHDAFQVGARAEPVHWVVAAGFVLNLLLVVAGLKLDWSFAMFSGLRPFGHSWLQRGGLRHWPRYYVLTLPERLPKPLLSQVRPDFLYRATREQHAVHEGVVYHLEAIAGEFGITFTPRIVSADRDRRELVPDGRGDQPRPRRTVLVFPAIVPRSFGSHYLG
jgi:hypothetical protein